MDQLFSLHSLEFFFLVSFPSSFYFLTTCRECICNTSLDNNNKSQVGFLNHPQIVNNMSDHGGDGSKEITNSRNSSSNSSIDHQMSHLQGKYDSEECINPVNRMEAQRKGPSETLVTQLQVMDSGGTSNLNSRLKSISLLDAVSTSSPQPIALHPPNPFAASASKSSYKLAWINHQSQSASEVKDLQGGPSKTGLPALVPPRKKSFSAVASSPFYSSSSNNLQVIKASKGKNDNSLDDFNCKILVNTSSSNNSNRITLPPLSSSISSSRNSGKTFFNFTSLLVNYN